LSKLGKEDASPYSTYSTFIDGMTLLAWDVGWLCKSQGCGTFDSWQDFCPLGRNLWQLLVRDKDALPQPPSTTGPSDERVTPRATPSLGAALMLGQYSHGTAHSFLGAAEGSELMRVWKMPGPKYLSDKVKATLSAQLQEAAWEILEEKDVHGHEVEEEPTKTRQVEDLRSVSSVATANTARTEGEDVSGPGLGRVQGWTKLKSRSGE